jgi:hypothetical protein
LFKASIIAGGSALSRVKGPPGIACIKKNVIDEITSKVKNMAIERCRIYLPTGTAPLILFQTVT